jgi:hypothetical protein
MLPCWVGETLLLPGQSKKNRHLKSTTLYLIINYGLFVWDGAFEPLEKVDGG